MTTFFLIDKESLAEVMKFFNIFSSFSGLKSNKSKCEVTGIGALKSIYLSEMSEKGLNCVMHLFNESQKLKAWYELKQEHSFHEKTMWLSHAIPKLRKGNLSELKGISTIWFFRITLYFNKKTPHVFSK